MFGVTPEAPPLVVVDWQTATEGNAMMDLAYMISGSFDPATRASVERDLLDDYLTRMRAAGVDYAADTMWRDYRLGSVWGVVMTVIATVLAAETERGNDMLTAMGQGHGRQAIELDALALLRGT
jgi:thiamine kinase-like enzyme